MELCLTGLFFLVRDTNGKAACTAQAIIMIFATVLTVLFHSALNHGHKLHWLPFFKAIGQPADQIGNEGKVQCDSGYERNAKNVISFARGIPIGI